MAQATRVTQLPISIVERTPKAAQVTQLPLSVVHVPLRPAQLTQLPITVVYLPHKPARLTQLPLSTTFNLDPVPPPALMALWPVEERWEWRTTIVKSLSGREQRMALRDEPFLVLSYDLAVMDDVDRQSLLYTFHRYGGKRLRYPLFHFGTPITEAASIGDTALTFDPTETDCRDGEGLAVYTKDLSSYRVLEIDEVTSTGCTLATALEASVAEGMIVAPAPLFRISERQSLSMSIHSGQASIELTSVPPRTIRRPGQDETLETLDTLPLVPDKYIIAGNTVEQVSRALETIDNGVQDPIDYRTWYYPQVSFPRAYLIEKSDVDLWRQFAHEVKGSLKPFLVPSHRTDFALSEVPALEATELTTEDTFVADWMKDPAFRYLRLTTQNGVIYRKVNSARLNMDRTVTIFLADALGGTTGDNVIEDISFVMKVRLTSDVITMTYHTHYALVSFAAATVEA